MARSGEGRATRGLEHQTSVHTRYDDDTSASEDVHNCAAPAALTRLDTVAGVVDTLSMLDQLRSQCRSHELISPLFSTANGLHCYELSNVWATCAGRQRWASAARLNRYTEFKRERNHETQRFKDTNYAM
jgi:hypothetical protein